MFNTELCRTMLIFEDGGDRLALLLLLFKVVLVRTRFEALGVNAGGDVSTVGWFDLFA